MNRGQNHRVGESSCKLLASFLVAVIGFACYLFRSMTGVHSMNQPRVQPLNPPYSADIQAAFDRVMPPGMPPLKLFRSMAHNPRVLQRMLAGGLLDHGSIELRERELLILRATALCGAEYEWGVHVAAFAGKAGFSAQQVADTCSGRIDPTLWSQSDQTLLELADSLHASSTVGEGLWQRLGMHFS